MVKRLETIAALAGAVEKSHGSMGRTALMKFMYFLQSLKGIDLGYTFRIYTYGPYDSQVLEDLKVAELKQLVEVSSISYATGYGYKVSPGAKAPDAATSLSPEIKEAVEAVASEFGTRTASDLEMASTILFVAHSRPEMVPAERIADEVKKLKPRLDLAAILRETKTMAEKGHIQLAG